MSRYVIINADDLGLSNSVNRGILEAHRLGTVSSASLMINTPGFLDAVSIAQSTPSLGVGLHCNLTYGSPVTDPALVPSLVREDGSFHGMLDNWTEQDISLELDNQYQRMVQHGLHPTHIDSHHHIHFYSQGVYAWAKRVAQQEQLPVRVHPSRPDPELPWVADTLMMHTFSKETGVSLLLKLVNNAPQGITEILCHPGYVDDDVRRLSTWTTAREEELQVFLDPQIAAHLANLHKRGVLHLIHYGQLPTIRTHGDLRYWTAASMSTPVAKESAAPVHYPRKRRASSSASIRTRKFGKTRKRRITRSRARLTRRISKRISKHISKRINRRIRKRPLRVVLAKKRVPSKTSWKNRRITKRKKSA